MEMQGRVKERQTLVVTDGTSTEEILCFTPREIRDENCDEERNKGIRALKRV